MKILEKTVLAIATAYSMLHLLIITQVIPFDIVWGGKITSVKTMYLMESIALLTMLFLGLVILMKNNIIKSVFTYKTSRKILLAFAGFFIINTLGNILATTLVERAQAIVTIYLSVSLLIISRSFSTN